MVYSKSLELKESKYEASWMEDTIRSIALSIWRKVDHNSEFKRPHIGNPCIKVLILVIRLNGSLK